MPKRSMLRLTKRIVERLKADGKDAIFWDRDLAGFGVRVHTTGRKLYIVQSRGPAGLKRVTLGRVGTETIDERRRTEDEGWGFVRGCRSPPVRNRSGPFGRRGSATPRREGRGRGRASASSARRR